jgi:hypothetical protein
VAREVEGRPGNGLQTQERSIKPFAFFQVSDHDADVIIFLHLDHREPPFSSNFLLDTPGKSLSLRFSVIPVKTGIQFLQSIPSILGPPARE